MDKVCVKLLFDEYGCKEYVFYESGKFATPLFILTEGFAETLSEELKALITDKEFTVREIKRG